MGINSKISWTKDTWNPWQGCIKVSPGCKFCYMYRDKLRWNQDPFTPVRSKDATFYAPLRGKLKGPLVFTCSWSDWFLEQADDWRSDAWDVIRQTPNLTYQILTKRADRIEQCLPDDWNGGWDNVWLGVSVETQDQKYRADILSTVPAKVRFLSCEPLLGPLDLSKISDFENSIDWVISGGESGQGDKWRPADTEWFRSLRDQCLNADVPFFHKQNGGNRKSSDGSWGGDTIDGIEYKQFPKVFKVDMN